MPFSFAAYTQAVIAHLVEENVHMCAEFAVMCDQLNVRTFNVETLWVQSNYVFDNEEDRPNQVVGDDVERIGRNGVL